MARIGLKILLVEDDDLVARAMAQHLAGDGHQVTAAKDGQSAITRAKELRPDAVVLDIGLPDRDGYDVARELRDRVLAADAAIIVLTGLPRAMPDRADEYVIDLHLTKPIAIDQLSGLIHFARGRRPPVGH